MGNFLTSSSSSATSDGKRDCGDNEDNDEDNYTLLKEEVSSIKSIYNAISLSHQNNDGEGKHSMEVLSAREKNISVYLGRNNRSALLSTICTRWLDHHVGSYQAFEKFVVDCTRVSPKQTVKKLLEMIREDKSLEVGMDKVLFFHVLIELCDYHKPHCDEVSRKVVDFYRWLQKSSRSVDHDEFKAFLNFLNKYYPFASKVFESHMSESCMPSVLNSPSYSSFHPPVLSQESRIIGHENFVPLAMHSRCMQGTWNRLYCSEEDGLSFNRLEHHILGYEGPTCILVKVRDQPGTVLGAFALERWKDQNRFYGSSSNILFSLHPKLRIYGSSGASNGHYQWLNTRSFGNSLPHGLGLGGSTDGFRFFIPESLEGCTASAYCPTYEPGRLLHIDEAAPPDSSNTLFELDVIEVWGTGGQASVAKGLLAQKKTREIVDESIRRARQVDKAALFDNDFNKEFLLSNTFQHKAQQSDRDCV